MSSFLERIPSTPLSKAIAAGLGLACYLRLMLRSHNMFGVYLLSGDGKTMLLFAFYGILVIAVFAVLIMLRSSCDEKFLKSSWFSFAAMALCPVTHLFLKLAEIGPLNNDLGAVVFVFVYAIGLATALCAWGAVIYQLDQRGTLIAAAIALPGYSLFAVLSPFGIRIDPPIVNICASTLMLVCWFLSFRPVRVITPRGKLGSVRELPLRTLVILLFCILACTVTTGILSLDEQDHAGTLALIASIVIPILMATALILGTRSGTLDERTNTIMLLVNIVLVVVVLFTAIVFSLLESDSRTPALLLNLTRRFCVICCIIALSKAMHEKALSPTYLFSLFGILALAVPSLIGHFVVPVLDHSTNEFILRYEEVFILIISGILIVAAFLSLTLDRILKVDENAENAHELKLQDAYEVIADGFGLTPREKEVMVLIAEGNSMKKVGELLFISLGTVQSHAKNIYRKLDIHSRQDLLDLIKEHTDGS